MIRNCPKCRLDKALTEYNKDATRPNGIKGCCKECNNSRRNALHAANPIPVMLQAAKQRAVRQSVLFTLTENDLVMPDTCPILGMKLEVKQGKGGAANSPSLDKIKPEFGYIPGNVQIISNLANVMKSNASLDQMVRLGRWASKQIKLERVNNTQVIQQMKPGIDNERGNNGES